MDSTPTSSLCIAQSMRHSASKSIIKAFLILVNLISATIVWRISISFIEALVGKEIYCTVAVLQMNLS